jgi:4-amino-4-deoxy-L-arabinose transferase-like glycosyltransferase
MKRLLRLFGPGVAVVASLVLCTAPLFSVSGRCALDMALYPPLALGALLLVTPPVPFVGAGRTAAAGLLLGLGVWNHVCFAPILLLFAAAALVALRRKRLSRAGLVAGLLGAALGLLPALWLARGRAGPGFAPAALGERLWLGVTVWRSSGSSSARRAAANAATNPARSSVRGSTSAGCGRAGR